jgi:hypothetical protein
MFALPLLALAGAHARAEPRSVLDRSTGATIVVSSQPWILALDQPHLAAHARDYIALYAVETNIAGQRSHHLAAFFWSTVLGRERYAGTAPEISLRVNDRQLRLSPLGKTPRDVGIDHWPLKPPGHGALLTIYQADEGLLRQLATAQHCRARPETDPTLPADVWFEVWRDGRHAYMEFVEHTLATP